MYKLFITFLTLFIVSLIARAEIDPTKPFSNVNSSSSNATIVNQESLRLDSIIHGNNVHTAVINGTLLKVGDNIGEYILVAVNDKTVVLSFEGERKELAVFSPIISR